MKKNMKRILSMVLVVCLLMVMSTTVFAVESDVEDGLTGPTDLFITVCDDLFAENSNYSAIDKNGNDITEEFLSTYRSAYMAENYEIIWDGVKNSLSVISWENETPQTRLLMNGSASDKR